MSNYLHAYKMKGFKAACAVDSKGVSVENRGYPGRNFSLSFTPPSILWYRAKHLPRIHDISTDIGNPPRYVAVLPPRKGAKLKSFLQLQLFNGRRPPLD
jgi:hypothetical protein